VICETFAGAGRAAVARVARMERSAIRDSSQPRDFPGYASLHPGYETQKGSAEVFRKI